MKTRTIQIATHKPTGAEIPIIVKKTDENNVIQEYKEDTTKRKGFTLKDLEERWNKPKDKVIALLQKYQIPAHLDHKNLVGLPDNKLPVDVAIFFEEYIYGIEKKTKMAHSKLKAKTI